MKTRGQVAFEAYNRARGGLTWDGKLIPPWVEVSTDVQRAWDAAAAAVVQSSFEQTAGQITSLLHRAADMVTDMAHDKATAGLPATAAPGRRRRPSDDQTL